LLTEERALLVGLLRFLSFKWSYHFNSVVLIYMFRLSTTSTVTRRPWLGE
jgi:hypothetical protein